MSLVNTETTISRCPSTTVRFPAGIGCINQLIPVEIMPSIREAISFISLTTVTINTDRIAVPPMSRCGLTPRMCIIPRRTIIIPPRRRRSIFIIPRKRAQLLAVARRATNGSRKLRSHVQVWKTATVAIVGVARAKPTTLKRNVQRTFALNELVRSGKGNME